MLCSLVIPGRLSLFCREMEQQWVWGVRMLGILVGVKGGQVAAGMYCMRESQIKRKILINHINSMSSVYLMALGLST